jgi:hypothetical protein
MLTPLRTKLSDLVQQVIAIRPKPAGGSTTLSANAAAGATAATLTSVTGFTDADPIIAGSEEDAELVVQTGAPAGSIITLRAPGFKRAHVSGEAVKEGIAYDLGNVMNVRDASAADVFDNETDVSRNPNGRRLGHIAYQPQFDVQGYSPNLFALLTGMLMNRVLGAGTSADPTQIHTDGSDLGREDTFLVFNELLADGTFLRHEFDACSADYSQMALALGQGRETMLAARFIAANHGLHNTVAPQFAIDYTLQARKAAQIESLLEAGLFTVLGGGLSTTLTSQTNKDANVFNVASATGVAGGKWYRVVGGGREQIIRVESVVSLAVTCRTRAAYDFPTGSTVTELTQTAFTGLKQDATEFRMGGSVRPVRFDNARVQAGARAGTALFSLACQPTARTLENLRLRLGLPTSAISGTALIQSNSAGTDAPIGWYSTSQRKDLKTVLLVGSDVDNGLEQLEMAMGKSDLASVSLAFRNQLISQLMW